MEKIELAGQVLRAIRAKNKQDLTPIEHRDLELATHIWQRIMNITLSDLKRRTALTRREECAWEEIVDARELLRVIEMKQKQELTPGERRDLEVAARSAKRVLAVALSDLL